MSSGSAMVAAASGSSLPMYDTSCSYQTALELKRMSSGGMTGVSPMTSSGVPVGMNMNPFGIKTEDCNSPPDWSGCGYRLPGIGCSGMSTFEQLKQSVEKAKAVLTAEVVANRETRNYFSASFSSLPNVGMGMNFSGSGGGSSTSTSSNDLILPPTHSTTSHHHHHSLHHHHHTSTNLFNDERLGGIELSLTNASSDKRSHSSSNHALNGSHRLNKSTVSSSSSPIQSLGGVESHPSSSGVKSSSSSYITSSSITSSTSTATASNSGEASANHTNLNNNNSNNVNPLNGRGGNSSNKSAIRDSRSPCHCLSRGKCTYHGNDYQ